MRGYAFNDKFTLFIGLGFHAGGMIDLLHALFAIINLGQPTFEAYFIPQTWVAGRIVMGLVIMIALVKFAKPSILEKTKERLSSRLVTIYTLLLAGLALGITGLSLLTSFPFVTIDFIIKRPYEMISAVFFLVALIFFYKYRIFRINDNLYKGLAICIVIDIFVNVIISYSNFVFDTEFNVAHVLKTISFFVLIMALSSSIIQHYKVKVLLNKDLETRTAQLASANVELKHIDKQKEEFASMVTHELKTPLSPIMIYCELLKDKSLGELSKEQIVYVNEIYRNTERLDRLIGDILDAQKLSMDTMSFNKQKIATAMLLDKIIKDFSITTDSKQIEFVNSNSSKSTIFADEDRITQVMENLIRNSVDFVPEKNGRIEVGARDEDSKVIFYVKDNGVGIPKDKQENLFKKFYQVDTSHRREHGGSGLGLVICKGIVAGLGGKIWFESEEGKGTSFYFSLPKKLEENVKIL